MTFHHNCIRDAEQLEYTNIGMGNEQREVKCKICGSVWREIKKEELPEGEQRKLGEKRT